MVHLQYPDMWGFRKLPGHNLAKPVEVNS